MGDYYTQILILSTFVMIFTLVSKYTKDKLHLPESFVSLIFGILVGKHSLNLIRVNPYGLYSISRMILCIQTMNVSLSLPMGYVRKHYKSLVVLVFIVGFIKCIFTYLLLISTNRFDININSISTSLDTSSRFDSSTFNTTNTKHSFKNTSWQMASSLTPTDPILCSGIIKGRLRIPPRIRLLLLAESGINDGLGIILLSMKDTTIISFIYNTLYKKVLLSASCGILLGFLSRNLFKFCYRRALVGMDSFIIHTFLLVLVSIGLMEILRGSEFICIFFCGIQFSSDEFISIEYDRNMQDTVDLLISTSFFVIFGSTIEYKYSIREILIGLIIICIRRPLICFLLSDYITDLRSKKEALFIGWFGPIGVGAIYYSMMVDLSNSSNILSNSNIVSNNIISNSFLKEGLYPHTSKIVTLSVCVHGMTILIYKIYTKLTNRDIEVFN